MLADDLGDQSLADYNLGNEEEDQLLADDYESGGPQNVPVSIGDGYSEVEMIPNDYQRHEIEYVTPVRHFYIKNFIILTIRSCTSDTAIYIRHCLVNIMLFSHLTMLVQTSYFDAYHIFSKH